MLRRAALILVGLAIAAAPIAQAGGGEPPAPSPPAPILPPAPDPPAGPPPAEPPPAEPLVVPDGVSISGVAVGGMTAEQAALVLREVFDRPLLVQHRGRSWTVRPDLLGARPRIDAAVARALRAAPGSAVDLVVVVAGRTVREYVAGLAESFGRPARDAKVRLVRLRPRVVDPRYGFAVSRTKTAAAIIRALKHGQRGPITLAGRVLRPRLSAADIGPVVVIRRESKKLLLYRGARLWRTFGVATGLASYPTPLGRFEVVVKWRNPWWYPPPSPWAAGEKPVPPGPGNPLGTRWMGLSAPLVGIHGTPDAASIGYSASHGCIRMLIRDAEWLFERVRIGTPVFIVRA